MIEAAWAGSPVLVRTSLPRMTRPWQSTVASFCPEISSGISKISYNNAFAGKTCSPLNSTPDWLMFSMVPVNHVCVLLAR